MSIKELENTNFKEISQEEYEKMLEETKLLEEKQLKKSKHLEEVHKNIQQASQVVSKDTKDPVGTRLKDKTSIKALVEKQQVVSEKKKEVVFVATPHETCQTLEELLVFSVENFEKILSKSDLQEELVVKAKKDKRLDIKLIETMKITKENLKELLNVVRELR
jgi:hypothetical protein